MIFEHEEICTGELENLIGSERRFKEVEFISVLICFLMLKTFNQFPAVAWWSSGYKESLILMRDMHA